MPVNLEESAFIDAIERNAEQINKCYGLDPRHQLLIQSVRELVKMFRDLQGQHSQQRAYADASVAVDDDRLAQLKRAVAAEREACARIAEEQPFYPDTHTGTRQRWVKEQIAAKIRERG